MTLGLGIDTGGTYTDTVIYDFDRKEILDSSKTLTTHDHLEIGIINALELLDQSYFKDIEIVALSTTLATNACVENKGARAKLIFFGVDKKVFNMVGANYGLADKDEVFLNENSSDFRGTKTQEPDWDQLFDQLTPWLKDAQGLGIVEVFAMNSGAKLEKRAKQEALERYDIPVVCGHELFYELNSIQRGASTLLNAKLVPIIQGFIDSIKRAFMEKGIDAPLAIIRSDSTKMSEEYSKMRPVETILSGPASSVTGGIKLTNEEDCLIIDMGGTTTDISIVKEGYPLKTDSGVKIGTWKTFVHGVFIDTFALGGDSTIRVDRGHIVQESRRMIPLCIAATRWPYIINELEELLAQQRHHSYPLYEFLLLQKDFKDIEDIEAYSKEELELCKLLENGPMLYEKAGLSLKKDVYSLNTKRLETEGIIIRIGLTPTDIMHIKGDFNKFDKRPVELTIQYLLNQILEDTGKDLTQDEFCNQVYDLIKQKLYENIVRILLEDTYKEIFKDGLGEKLSQLITSSYLDKNKDLLPLRFKSPVTLVGIGGPTHIFLPDVAKMLGCKCIIPSHAKIANAVGAILSNVRSDYRIEIMTETDGRYAIFGPDGRHEESDFQMALEYAKKLAKEAALKDARAKGLSEDFDLDISYETKIAKAAKEREIDLGTVVNASVRGKIKI